MLILFILLIALVLLAGQPTYLSALTAGEKRLET